MKSFVRSAKAWVARNPVLAAVLLALALSALVHWSKRRSGRVMPANIYWDRYDDEEENYVGLRRYDDEEEDYDDAEEDYDDAEEESYVAEEDYDEEDDD